MIIYTMLRTWENGKSVWFVSLWHKYDQIKHCETFRNFTLFPGVEILWKGTISGDLPKTMQKLCLSTKFPLQEIR